MVNNHRQISQDQQSGGARSLPETVAKSPQQTALTKAFSKDLK